MEGHRSFYKSAWTPFREKAPQLNGIASQPVVVNNGDFLAGCCLACSQRLVLWAIECGWLLQNDMQIAPEHSADMVMMSRARSRDDSRSPFEQAIGHVLDRR